MAPGGTTPASRAYGDPWGTLTWSGTAPAIGLRSRFTDPVTGWVVTPARWYVPALSRFASPDPLPGDPELPLSLNRYAYALDDPVSLSDPSGLRPVCGEGCTPEEEAELVRAWAGVQAEAASGTRAYDRGPLPHDPALNLPPPRISIQVDEGYEELLQGELVPAPLQDRTRSETAAYDGWCDGYGRHEDWCGLADAVFLGAWGESATLLAEQHAECWRQGDRTCMRVMETAETLHLGILGCYSTYRWGRPGRGPCRRRPPDRRDGTPTVADRWWAYQS